jgi:hypothetical protein
MHLPSSSGSVPKPMSSHPGTNSPSESSILQLSISISTSLSRHLCNLCDYFSTSSAGYRKFACLELIYQIMDVTPNDQLEKISPLFWNCLLETSLSSKSSSIYSVLFYRILYLLVARGSVALVRSALVRPKVIARLIDSYENNQLRCDLDAFVLLLFNFLRLTADARGPRDYLSQILRSNHKYHGFLSQLR